jgi:ABC-type amino acid transport substrate-binding protein
VYNGFEVDLLHHLAEALGTNGDKPNIAIHHVEWDDLLTQLADNQIDLVISSMTKTKLREKNFNILFSDGYFTTHQRFIFREGTAGCLKDMIIGVVGGNPETTNQRAAKLLSERLGYGTYIKPLANATELLLLDQIRHGDVGAGLVDDVSVRKVIVDGQDVTGLEFFGEYLDPLLQPLGFYGADYIGYSAEEFAMAVQSRESDLLRKMNDVLAALKKDGTLQKMQQDVREGLVSKVAKRPLC